MQLTLKLPNKKTLVKVAVIAAVVVIVLGLWGPRLVLFFQTRFLPFSSGWEAIYLVNGDVFVGHIRGFSGDSIKLNNAYAVKINSDNQNLGGNAGAYKLSGNINGNISLVKWGFNQPFKSAGVLFIGRTNTIFWEKLDEDSEIVKRLQAQ